jgi:hypothetical protein
LSAVTLNRVPPTRLVRSGGISSIRSRPACTAALVFVPPPGMGSAMLPERSNTAATSTTLPATTLAVSAKVKLAGAEASLWLSSVSVALASVSGAALAKNAMATSSAPSPVAPPSQDCVGATV